MRRTKIVCTVGPATASTEMLHRIVEAGADVLRLNFSHGEHSEHRAVANRIRSVSAELRKPVAILQDLPGPKVRIGAFPEKGSIQLNRGEHFTITTEDVAGDERRVGINYPAFADDVRKGQTLLLADGAIELEVQEVAPPNVHCCVVLGGSLSGHKGVNVPRGVLNLSAFTKEDQMHLAAGMSMGVDLVALSFVRSRDDIASARRFLRSNNADLPLMAKIEKPEAVEDLDAILREVDSVMVARGDLGLEIPLPEVPLVQKSIVRKAVRAAKPVVIATQMLRSMVESPRPTRAEAADVANAVLDGADALMLSEETAVGEYPVESVRIMASIAESVERHSATMNKWSPPDDPVEKPGTPEAIAHAACLLARELRASAILCFTRTGRTARLVSRHRPAAPVIGVAFHEATIKRLTMTWGVQPLLMERYDSTDKIIEEGSRAAVDQGLISPDQTIVIVGGSSSTPTGESDFLRVGSQARIRSK